MTQESHASPETPKRSSLQSIWAFVRILNVRLRFIFLMVLVGVISSQWENIMNHYDRLTRPQRVAYMVESRETEYYCPMHPNIVRAEPGNCPICGMPLVKRAKTGSHQLPEGVLSQVQLTPQKVQLGRIGTSPVEYQLLSREIRTVGIVDYDETRRAFISSRIKGRIDNVLVNYVGQHVEKGDPLVQIYSPDLLVAQQELLTAIRALEQQKGADSFVHEGNKSLVESSRQKLLLWGITEEQVNEIVRRGTPDTHLIIYSPLSGIVTEKNVLAGHYVNEGDDLYTIADLSVVWMQAKIFEDQIGGVQIGTAVQVTSTAYPNETFAGRITFIAYSVDPGTRTISARVEIANPDDQLKPGMYASAVIRLPSGKVQEIAQQETPPAFVPVADQHHPDATAAEHFATGYFCPIYPDRLYDKPELCPIDKFPFKFVKVEKVLAVPVSAVINTGTRQVVYRETTPGVFDMVEVQLGSRAGEYYPVISGLSAGEQIATAGAFLVDAENRLNPSVGAQYFGASGGSQEDRSGKQPGHQH